MRPAHHPPGFSGCACAAVPERRDVRQIWRLVAERRPRRAGQVTEPSTRPSPPITSPLCNNRRWKNSHSPLHRHPRAARLDKKPVRHRALSNAPGAPVQQTEARRKGSMATNSTSTGAATGIEAIADEVAVMACIGTTNAVLVSKHGRPKSRKPVLTRLHRARGVPVPFPRRRSGCFG